MLPIFFTLLILTAANQCPLITKFQSNLYTDSFSLLADQNQTTQYLQYNVTFQKQFISPPSIAHNIKSFSGLISSLIQINITTIDISEEQFQIIAESTQQSKWKSIKLNVLISTRKDIEIGSSFTINPILFIDQTFPVQYQPISQIDREKTRVKAFISSFQIYSESETIGIKYIQQDQIDGFINFYFQIYGNSNVKFLKIAVIIFHIDSPGLIYSYGLIQKNSIISIYQQNIPKHDIKQLKSYIVGLLSFQFNTSSLISLSTDISDRFTLQIDSNQNNQIPFLAVNYLIFSVIQCGSCTQFPYSYQDTCRYQCPSNTYQKYGRCIPNQCNSGFQKRDQNQCIPLCDQNQYFSEKDCICNQGYYWINSSCNKCDDGTYYNYKDGKCLSICGNNAQFNKSDRRCYCNIGYYIINKNGAKSCDKCSVNQVYDQNQRICQNKCPQNQIYTNSVCQCQDGFNRINGKCSQCPSQSTYSPLFNTCSCPEGIMYDKDLNICVFQNEQCEQNQVYFKGKCQCKTGYNKIGNKCRKCPQNSHFNQTLGHCKCNTGYKFYNNRCTDQRVNCYANQEEINGKCQCISGYIRNSNNICERKVCELNQVLNVYNLCECKIKYRRSSNGNCQQIKCAFDQKFDTNKNICVSICSQYQIYDEQLQICLPKCPTGQKYNIYRQRCEIECQNNQYWNGYSCICQYGFEKVYNSCLPKCRNNQIRNNNGVCQCINGYRNINNYCIAIQCPSGQIYDSSYNICRQQCQTNQIWNTYNCICKPGYERNEYLQCVISCPAYHVNLNGKCVCIQGYYSYNNYCIPINCGYGYRWDSQTKKCISNCSANSYYNGSQCVCNYNYEKDLHNQCVQKCKQYQERVNGQCICIGGFRRSLSGLCVQIICPINQYYNLDLKSCVDRCPQYQTWNGSICTCINGYQKYGNNCISICGINQQRVNGVCQCLNGYQKYGSLCIAECGTDQYRINGICQCLDGYQKYGNSCVLKCGINQQRVNGICQCLNGYQKYGDVCVAKCGSNQIRLNGICQCQNDYQIYGDVCVAKCGINQIRFNAICQCIIDYQKYGDVCVAKCQYNQYRVNGVCQCLNGFQKYRNTCVLKCGFNQQRVNGVCQCREGYSKNSSMICIANTPASCLGGAIVSQVTNNCVCILPQIWIIGRCQIPVNTCGYKAYWNGYGCYCFYGYYMKDGVCTPTANIFECPLNSYFNGFSCTCFSGFYPTTPNQCTQCPQNTYWNGTSCSNIALICAQGFRWNFQQQICQPYNQQCSQNQFWDGFNCRCKQNYFLINQKCITCPNGTFFDGVQCATSQLIKRTCPGPYQFYNGRICVCVKDFFQVGNVCVTCPINYKWNGYYCEQSVLFSLTSQTEDEDEKKVVGSNTVVAKLKKNQQT